MTARPVPEAARALGVSTSTLRRWMQAGAPVARRGRRGRGCRALVDPVAVLAWREGERGDVDATLRELAGRLPELIGDAMAEAFRMADKRNGAWVAVAGWQLAVSGILDHLGERVPDLPEPEVPERVEVPDYAHLLPEEIRSFTGRGVYDDENEHLSFTQGGGHGGSHPHLVHNFIRAVREGYNAYPNAVESANITCVGILAHESAIEGGVSKEMPAFTLELD